MRLPPVGEASRRIAYPPEALTGILLGYRISDEHKDNVLEWAAELSHLVEVGRVEPADERYALEKRIQVESTD